VSGSNTAQVTSMLYQAKMNWGSMLCQSPQRHIWLKLWLEIL